MRSKCDSHTFDSILSSSRRSFLIALGGAALAATARGRAHALANTVNAGVTTIIGNAQVWTGDPGLPNATAIALAGNTIFAVGANDEIRQMATSATRIIDADGGFLMPGFNDSHLHMTILAADRRNVNLIRARTISEVLGAIRDRVSSSSPGEWIISRAQWHEALLDEARMPTANELDHVSPDNPVFIPRGGHVAAANSRALKAFGIDRNTVDPPGGIIVRGNDGIPTGMLLESARWNAARQLPPLDKAAYRVALREQIADFSALGITSLTNPATTPFQIEQLELLHRESPLSIRVHWTIGGAKVEDVHALRATRAPQEGDDFLRFAGFGEVLTDGGIEGAALRDPYQIVPGEQPDPNYRGVVLPFAENPDAAIEFYLAAIDAGYSVMTHVTGDAALDIALRILTKVQSKRSFRHLRWTLHGCFLVDEAQLTLIRDLGLIITAQAQPYLLGAQQVRWWGRTRADRSIPMRQFLDAGIRVGGGSDAPAGIANPMESIGWMVNRLCIGGVQLDRSWSITPEEALVAYTRGSAETQFMEHRVGVLRPGMLADLVLLSDNPLRVPRETLAQLRAELTILNGRVVFDRHTIAS